MDEVSELIASLMADLTFYRQQRVDGGTRTGMMLGPTTILENFEEGEEEYDPSLAWSIDLRCKGTILPTTANDAKDWLLAHESLIREGFDRYADQLRAGSDPTGPYLLEWSDFQGPPEGVAMKIVCGAMRRIDAYYLSKRLKFVGENWRPLIEGLQPHGMSLVDHVS